jgi:hypothetical protein
VILDMILPFRILAPSIYSLAIFIASFTIGASLIFPYNLPKYSKYPESAFLCAFFVTSTIFEPDLGSFSRHGFLYIPLVIRCMYLQHFTEEQNAYFVKKQS